MTIESSFGAVLSRFALLALAFVSFIATGCGADSPTGPGGTSTPVMNVNLSMEMKVNAGGPNRVQGTPHGNLTAPGSNPTARILRVINARLRGFPNCPEQFKVYLITPSTTSKTVWDSEQVLACPMPNPPSPNPSLINRDLVVYKQGFPLDLANEPWYGNWRIDAEGGKTSNEIYLNLDLEVEFRM
jgi:hypothetical protein